MNLREKLNIILLSESKEDVKWQITNYIVECINKNKYPSIIDISNNCYIAKSSIVRYAKSFGLEGYKEFINKIKFEDQNSYKTITTIKNDLTKGNEQFFLFKNSIINFVNEADEYLSILEDIKIEILKAKRIYIHSSYEFDTIANYLKNFLIIINKNVVYSEHKKTTSAILDYIEETDLQIFLVAGVDNNYLETIFAYSMANNKSKKILISSTSQSNKFIACDISLVINFSDDYSKIYDKEIKMFYILKQLLILLEKENDSIDLRNLKHRF
ncbi:MurR/RpiR family transcriptional regulator [Spiroplasma diminutum]|uniref:HTH rpiR-type domain-containing protein n=1 Tax=Spiroplasma diminutum CUAS-1 TaxID=1276221 RepID=S5M0A8_9MOLU|nr:MurR/RpiR family transcriptional regulator [Spiroplasma diminutum]AGR42276.1 hypothetical protein SDIMI_v3c05720 [Spiroplasma diminutum CUAS-1]